MQKLMKVFYRFKTHYNLSTGQEIEFIRKLNKNENDIIKKEIDAFSEHLEKDKVSQFLREFESGFVVIKNPTNQIDSWSRLLGLGDGEKLFPLLHTIETNNLKFIISNPENSTYHKNQAFRLDQVRLIDWPVFPDYGFYFPIHLKGTDIYNDGILNKLSIMKLSEVKKLRLHKSNSIKVVYPVKWAVVKNEDPLVGLIGVTPKYKNTQWLKIELARANQAIDRGDKTYREYREDNSDQVFLYGVLVKDSSVDSFVTDRCSRTVTDNGDIITIGVIKSCKNFEVVIQYSYPGNKSPWISHEGLSKEDLKDIKSDLKMFMDKKYPVKKE